MIIYTNLIKLNPSNMSKLNSFKFYNTYLLRKKTICYLPNANLPLILMIIC